MTGNTPGIRYVRTSDGVDIAYTLTGSGPPLLVTVPVWYSNVAAFWRAPSMRALFRSMSERFTVCLFDWRNTGSSSKGVDYGPDHWANDIDAVAGLFSDRVNLLVSDAEGVALHFAVRNSECVERLVTWNLVRSSVWIPTVNAVAPLFRLDTSWLRAFSRWLGGDNLSEDVQQDFADAAATSTDPAYAANIFEQYAGTDLTPLLSRIAVPTLVMHRRGLGVEAGVDLAAHIPGAELRFVEGSSYFWVKDVEDPLPIIFDYLGALRPQSHAGSSLNGLSARECEVLVLLASGRSNRQTAESLTISEATVATHVRHILQKTGSANRVEATNWARDNGVV